MLLVPGSDYLNPSPNTLSFPTDIENMDKVCANLTILQDDNAEGNHTLLLSLENATQGSIIGPVSSVSVVIFDDGICYNKH